MITQEQYHAAVERAVSMLQQAGFTITPAERRRLEVADLGLGELEKTGLEILTYVNTERVCAKEIIMFPHQTCPEHWHPTAGARLGKEETFRCRWGTVYLYVPGTPTPNPACRPLLTGKKPHLSKEEWRVNITPARMIVTNSCPPHTGPMDVGSNS